MFPFLDGERTPHLLRQHHATFCESSSTVCFTARVLTYPLSAFIRSHKTGGFDDRALAVNPLRLAAVQPGDLRGQPKRNDGHTGFAQRLFLEHLLLVFTQPDLDLFPSIPRFLCAWICSRTHAKKPVVPWLIEQPDTKRRCMRPVPTSNIASQASALGSGSCLSLERSCKRSGSSFLLQPGRSG